MKPPSVITVFIFLIPLTVWLASAAFTPEDTSRENDPRVNSVQPWSVESLGIRERRSPHHGSSSEEGESKEIFISSNGTMLECRKGRRRHGRRKSKCVILSSTNTTDATVLTTPISSGATNTALSGTTPTTLTSTADSSTPSGGGPSTTPALSASGGPPSNMTS